MLACLGGTLKNSSTYGVQSNLFVVTSLQKRSRFLIMLKSLVSLTSLYSLRPAYVDEANELILALKPPVERIDSLSKSIVGISFRKNQLYFAANSRTISSN